MSLRNSSSRRNAITVVAVAAVAMLLAGTAQAQPGGGFFGGPMGGHQGARDGGGPGGGDGPMEGWLLRGLDLSSDQQAEIKALFEAHRDAMATQMEALRKAHGDLMALALSDAYNDAAAAALIETASGIESELAADRARTMNAVYQLLTPEQRTELAEQLARFAEARPGRGGWHH